jgi:hypothetical protein
MMPASKFVPGPPVGLLILLLLTSCARMSTPNLPTTAAVGHVTGRLEAATQSVSVIHMQAMTSQKPNNSSRTPLPRVSIKDGGQQPRIALVRPDQPLRVVNLDAIYHEIFTAGPDNQFRVRLASGQESAPIPLRTPGFVRGYCRLHPRENFAFLVTKADHVVYLEHDSEFEIQRVPVGEYRIVATGLDAESEETRFRVEADRTVELTLRLEPRLER